VRVVPSAAGPEEELARLARPTGPWIHLLDAAPADARQLGWMLGRDGIVVRHLRGHCGRSTYGLLDEMGAALQLPGDPVEHWAGLAALLTDMSWLPGAGHVLVVSRSSLLLAASPPSELAGLVEVVREVARARAEEGEPVPFHLVLQDDTLGLAALRARLDAAGARYAELAGWDAEEPSDGAAVSARSSLTGGSVDEVDLAAGVAVSTLDGVRSLGRAWESFRGGSGGPVRVYVPVLGGPVDLVAVVGSLSAAVVAAGACCVVTPVPADPALADPRQSAVIRAATLVWPTPTPATDSDTAPGAAAAGVLPPDQAAGLPTAGAAVPAAGHAVPWPSAADGQETEPGEPDGREDGGPGDAAGAGFELIAANLQWPFDSGSEEDDAVDAALRAHAEGNPRTAALFRTWVLDPAGSWVRVVLGYVNRGSIADVDSERTALVDTLQQAGAARCCVEVLAVSDVTDAHRWLEARCRPLWRPAPAAGPTPATGTPPTGTPPTGTPPTGSPPDEIRPGPRPDTTPRGAPAAESRRLDRQPVHASAADGPLVDGQPADAPPLDGQPADAPPLDGQPADASPVDASPVDGQPADALPVDGTPVDASPVDASPVGAPAPSVSGDGQLAPDAVFRAGPGLDDGVHGEMLTAMVEWAAGKAGVVGLVTAYADDRLVVGVALDGEADPDEVRGSAPAAVEPFVPVRGLDPVHLRLSRSSTRIWTRRAERAQPQPARPPVGAQQPPDLPPVVEQGPPPTRDTDDPRGDVAVGGFTLVGIDRETAVGRGGPQPDAQDAALVEFAKTKPGAIALLRGATEQGLKVYLLAVEESVDPEAARRELATAAAAAGLARAALEAFVPAGAISAFHLDLAVGTTRLWPIKS
jgi:hypothetical protein